MTRHPGLALFDLDHTLIPFDSGMAWSRFLLAHGRLPPDFEAGYLAFGRQYAEGTLDVHDLHRWVLAPLTHVPMAELDAWFSAFGATLPARMPAPARGLLQAHRAAGHLCAIVTATDRFISAPFAQALGAPHLVATEAEVIDGRLTGQIAGEPCFRAGKIVHVHRWLASLGLAWSDFECSTFYSDSINDLPLLQAVSHPVAVMPDAALRAHAQQHGWPIADSLEAALDHAQPAAPTLGA